MSLIEIPARRGRAAFLQAGQVVEVINTHGEQVVDTWAFSRNDLGEFLSNEHTRAHTLHMTPRPGDILRSNRRRPILTLIEDTSGGVHDTLIAACDSHRYAFLGVQGHHDNCQDHLFAAMAELGLTPPEVPKSAESVLSPGLPTAIWPSPRRLDRSPAASCDCARRWISSSSFPPALKTSCR